MEIYGNGEHLIVTPPKKKQEKGFEIKVGANSAFH